MDLIATLACGVRGAESGTVDLYLRGTSTPATYYTDFEGTASATGTAVPLDANGGAILFVNALVRVVVKSALGATVREFVAGHSAPCVEIRSSSITGTAYSGGAVAAGNPTNLKLWADMWLASAGAIDFKVAINGVATDLDSAFAAVAGLRYFVVTDPAYGAVGDGVTNNLGAFQAAINAANAAGGGVVFVPRGTFLINGTLTTYATVAMLGADRATSFINVTNAAATFMTGAPLSSIASLTITPSAADYTGTLILATSTGGVRVRDVQISGNVSGSLFSAAAAALFSLEASGCTFGTRSTGYVVNQSAGVIGATFYSCAMTASSAEAAANSVVLANVINVYNSTVTIGSTGFAGTKTVFNGPASIRAVGNTASIFAGTATVTMFNSSGALTESGNIASSGTGTMVMYAAALALANSSLGSRVGRSATVDADVDPVTLSSLNHRHVQARVTNAGAWVGNCQVVVEQAPRGSDLIASFWNDTAGGVTFEWSTNVSVAAATTFVVAPNSIRTFYLVSSNNSPTSSTLEWFLVTAVGGAEVVE
jgi:hypothetical protein